MSWRLQAVRELRERPCWGYRQDGSPAAEPTALAALALFGEGQIDPAREAARWLVAQQTADGSVGARADGPSPRWPTSLAVLLWTTLAETGVDARQFTESLDTACHWILSTASETLPRATELGHDTKLVAWPWVEGTHAWVEPTALCVLALKACGHAAHPRTREAVWLLIDRLLPQGGCNYGNTRVLGRTLRPHLQPSGLALLALAGEKDVGRRIERSLRYVAGDLTGRTPAVSLSWSLLGLAAHGHRPSESPDWLALAAERNARRDASPLKAALLLLADQAERSPLVAWARAESHPFCLTRDG